MPKTTVNKDHFFAGRKNQIRFAGEIFPMKSKTIAQGMKMAANRFFRFSITAFHAPHYFAALLGTESVGH